MKLIKMVGLVVLGALLASLLFVKREEAFKSDRPQEASTNVVYDRVQKTGVIHCGYSSWKPLFYIDPSTGEKRGIFHDLMEEIGTRLGYNIDWQEELGWGTVTESVRSKRVDMACSGYYTSAARAKDLSMTFDQLYTPLYVYVRADDTRTLSSLEMLNDPAYTVARIDGSGENAATVAHFPDAKSLTLAETSTSADEIQSLLTHKVDFVVLDTATASNYDEANPNQIKKIFPTQPIVEFPNVMLLPPGELRLKEMIDAMLRNLEYDGTLDKILARYHAEHQFLRNPGPNAGSSS